MSGFVALMAFVMVAESACASNTGGADSNTSSGASASPTTNPGYAGTLQQDAALTAIWITTLTPPVTPTTTSTPQPEPAITTGTPLAALKGDCAAPTGYSVQSAQGFCIVVPDEWAIQNIDGGMAAQLKTTPGQSISLLPDWAADASVCQLLIYISTERSIMDHLVTRHDDFIMQGDFKHVSPIQANLLGNVGVVGFTWLDSTGNQGGIYASMIDAGRMVHISYGGSNCSLDQLLPVLQTLRFN